MPLSYSKLWKILIDRKMTKTELRLQAKLTSNTLARLGREEVVDMQSLMKICDVLQCNLSEIMDYIPEDEAAPDEIEALRIAEQEMANGDTIPADQIDW